MQSEKNFLVAVVRTSPPCGRTVGQSSQSDIGIALHCERGFLRALCGRSGVECQMVLGEVWPKSCHASAKDEHGEISGDGASRRWTSSRVDPNRSGGAPEPSCLQREGTPAYPWNYQVRTHRR